MNIKKSLGETLKKKKKNQFLEGQNHNFCAASLKKCLAQQIIDPLASGISIFKSTDLLFGTICIRQWMNTYSCSNHHVNLYLSSEDFTLKLRIWLRKIVFSRFCILATFCGNVIVEHNCNGDRIITPRWCKYFRKFTNMPCLKSATAWFEL